MDLTELNSTALFAFTVLLLVVIAILLGDLLRVLPRRLCIFNQFVLVDRFKQDLVGKKD